MEELGATYDIQHYPRDPKTLRAPASLRAVHPLGKSPVVSIDGEVFAESGAIVEELLDRLDQGRLRPEPGTDAHRRYRFFLHYAEGSLMPPLLVRLITTRLKKAPMPFFAKPIATRIADTIDANFTEGEITNHLGFLGAELAERAYLAGDELSGADIQMSYPVAVALSRADVTTTHPLKGYLERLESRDAYKRAVERGGPLVFEA